MRRYTIIICVLAIITLTIPTGNTSAMGKLGPALQVMRLDPIHQDAEKIPVLIRLQEPCVIQQVTDEGQFFISTHELNKPTNFRRVTALTSIFREQQNSIETLLNNVDDIEILNTYQMTTNSVRALIPKDMVATVTELECVAKVFYEAPVSPDRWHSRGPLNCWPVYDSEEDLDGDQCVDPQGRVVNGKGIICAVSDTGLDYTHPDFGSQSRSEGNKVVISHDFATSEDDCQEIEGRTSHGTCCAGIIAADGPDNEKGIAPKALLAGYQIAGPSGGLSGDIGATWELMVEEGVDVSNNSYGAPRGYSSMEELQNNAVLAGVSVIASQGNEGSPGPNLPITCGSTSSPANVIAVGATEDWATCSKLIITDAPDIDAIGTEYKGIWGATGEDFTESGRPIKVLDCGWGRQSDFSGLDLNGKIALIQRGPVDEQYGPPLTFAEKVLNASENGAIAIILYNHSNGFIQAFYGSGPAVASLHLLKSQGLEIRNLLHEGNDWEIGTVDDDQNDVYVKITKPEGYGNITSFTSQGPTIYGTLKPDVCAPGDSIRSTYPMWTAGKTINGVTFDNPPYTDSFGGTSAAGPFVCGVACLVRQARPQWDPLEVKRAIMNTSVPLTRYIDDEYVPLLSQGMGRANAFDACMTDLLIQPPSALIIQRNGVINIDDQPEEIKNKAKKAQLPADIQNSMIAFKIRNYSPGRSHTVELSYEVNSRQADDIKVTFTSDTVTIPSNSDAWVGIDIQRPSRLEGGTNDIFIWFTDKKTGQKWHTGVCIYNNIPSVQGVSNTYASHLEYANLGRPPTLTPNGDGITDGMKVNYTLTNGSFNQWLIGRSYWPYYNNFCNGMSFSIRDYNGDSWGIIHTQSVVELGEHEFSWDGLGSDGEYMLPNGEWYLGLETVDVDADYSAGRLIDVPVSLTLFKNPFQVADSVVAPLPTISAYALPSSPGKGSEFMLGIYVEHATNLKSIQFNLVLPGLADLAEYQGYELGDFMQRDVGYVSQSATSSKWTVLGTVQHEEKSDKIWIDIQRPHDGVSGEGWLLFIKLLPKVSNFLDVSFENLRVSFVNEETSREELKLAFYNTASITIEDKFYEPADFNQDGKVNQDDLDIISEALGSKKGDEAFNWRCDLNRDRIIDMKDMAEFAKAMKP